MAFVSIWFKMKSIDRGGIVKVHFLGDISLLILRKWDLTGILMAFGRI